MTASLRLWISIAIIWLFTVSGIIGISIGYKDWFLRLTPLNLGVYFLLIFWNADTKITLLKAVFVPFVIGMLVEYLGVNYGLIFGTYEYGENLGVKVAGVPWMIGVNWGILVYCTAVISKQLTNNIWISSSFGALLMVLMDIVIEKVAPRFDFWEFENGVVPIQNYIGWLVTAFIAHLLFQYYYKKGSLGLSIHVFMAILVFFGVFAFLIES